MKKKRRIVRQRIDMRNEDADRVMVKRIEFVKKVDSTGLEARSKAGEVGRGRLSNPASTSNGNETRASWEGVRVISEAVRRRKRAHHATMELGFLRRDGEYEAGGREGLRGTSW